MQAAVGKVLKKGWVRIKHPLYEKSGWRSTSLRLHNPLPALLGGLGLVGLVHVAPELLSHQPHRQRPTHFQILVAPVAPVAKKTRDRTAQTCSYIRPKLTSGMYCSKPLRVYSEYTNILGACGEPDPPPRATRPALVAPRARYVLPTSSPHACRRTPARCCVQCGWRQRNSGGFCRRSCISPKV